MVLKGKVALVTGAGGGIGAGIAEAYAEAGADLVLADLNDDSMEPVRERCEAHGVRVKTVAVDVTDPHGTKEMIDGCVADFGRIDVLVNGAGLLTEAPLVEMDPALWDQMISVDLTSVFLCCRWAAPYMVAQNSGRIINIASQLGIKGGEGLVHYSAAKAGVIGLTKALARELAPNGVLVNAIAPGPIETPLLAGITEQWRDAKQAELPLGRFGTVREVAPTAVLLASDPGGNLYVGQVLGPNSGDVMP
ncbi:SDR family NAD(P)-dependent oxidoreductase [Gordonia sp. (in: high G+C Gram-positive bacteria)]|uniref:SDR family NAD(P)-dependent oxidoreductase n=1 Tax=Gordonia sp. (in: high G+C Gram-positive bacteria) TaxID=84139 RepID=UPI003C71B4DA